MEYLPAVIVVLAAYFIKGLSGFGPALLMVPFLSILIDPPTAITVTALMDFLAGALLLPSVRKNINWKFVLQLFSTLAAGAVAGTYLLGEIPVLVLEKIIGSAILVFAILIMIQKNENHRSRESRERSWWRYPIGFLSGLLGGLLGISGPPLIIYMKMHYAKTFFRTQLIGIFFLGTGWRFFLYQVNRIEMHLTLPVLSVFVGVMIVGLILGSKIHVRVSETVFNRIVAGLIIIPAVNLIF